MEDYMKRFRLRDEDIKGLTKIYDEIHKYYYPKILNSI